MTPDNDTLSLQETPLTAMHRAAGAKMGAFAGYDMPIHYPDGILAEHRHTRARAGLFDVSHMGPCLLEGPDVIARLERLVPGDLQGLAVGRMRYTVLLNPSGGVVDDLMVLKLAETRLFLVLNASRKAVDLALLREHVGPVAAGADRALLAVQGPEAARVVRERFGEMVDTLPFMGGREQGEWIITRSGYTGENGFEIALPAHAAEGVARDLLADPAVRWAGLGARDTLRLEAGLCLYGHELDETVSPVEADLAWIIGKRRREAGDFPGGARIQAELASGPARRRVGLRLEGRTIAREGTPIRAVDGSMLGTVTSGGFSPTLGVPVAMGYVVTGMAAVGTPVQLEVRGQLAPARVVALPFVPHAYRSGT